MMTRSTPELLAEVQRMFDLRAQKKCPFCGREIDPAKFRDKLSIKEFEISGLCQACQDDFFGR